MQLKLRSSIVREGEESSYAAGDVVDRPCDDEAERLIAAGQADRWPAASRSSDGTANETAKPRPRTGQRKRPSTAAKV